MSTIKPLGIPKIKALGLGNTEELIRKIESVANRYDFLPVVKINSNELSKNAVFSLNNCKNSPLESIDLGLDYDRKLRTYSVANIIIAKNSVSRIPLLVKMGYDPVGFQDGDGILEFKCSNSSVKLKFIDNDDTDYDEGEDKYNLKDAEYGDEFVLEINASTLARSTKFSISVYASDDGDGVSKTSNRKEICGKFNFKVVEKDVFLKEEVDKLEEMIKTIAVKINKSPNTGEYRKTRNYCVFATDRYIGALLNNNKDFYTYNDSTEKVTNFESLLSGTFRAGNLKKNGYISDYVIYKDNELLKPISANIQKVKDDVTYDALSIKKGLLMGFISKSINNKIGFHIFYTTYSDDFHVQTLIIDNTNPCNATYRIVDQHGETSSNGKLSDIENGFKDQSSWTYVNFYLNSNKQTLTKTISSIWKIQRN